MVIYTDYEKSMEKSHIFVLFIIVRATAVRRDAERNAVLAGDPKEVRLLCNTTLITDIPSRHIS